MTELAALLPFIFLGAIAGLDVVSFPQAMISRPLVSATLAGALAGAPGQGLLAGVVLELFAHETLPFGASRYPEWGSAGVVGGALLAAHHGHGGGAMAVAVFAALATASVSVWTMSAHRRMIARWAGALQPQLAEGSVRAVYQLQLSGLTADLVRGGLLTGVALLVFERLSRVVLASWTIAAEPSRAVVLALAGAVGAAAAWKVVHSESRAPWYLLGGLAVGTAVAFVR